jgi:Protein of unknown function (DUF4236)
MGLRFRQSFQLFPGVRLNLSGSGVSASFGVAGATINVGKRGVRSTVGIPGTGVSFSQLHGGGSSSPQAPATPAPSPFAHVPPQPFYAQFQAHQMREINSASVESLTSHSLVELRDLIAQARTQRGEIDADLKEANAMHARDTRDLQRRQRSIFRFMYKKRIAALEESVPETASEVIRLTEWRDSTHIDLTFETCMEAQKAYASLARAFDTLRSSSKIWDITSDRHGNRVIERSYASRQISRMPTTLDYAASDLVRFDGRAMRFGNINGEDILIYPGVVLMPRDDGAFALVDLREVELTSHALQFVEEETVPPDTQVAGYTWAKVNKDGSPDRRFNGNYQIPLAVYGRLLFMTAVGVEEEYQFSNASAAFEFARAFTAYQAALSA